MVVRVVGSTRRVGSEFAGLSSRRGPAKDTLKRVILGGRIVYNEGAFSYDCRIRDLSEGGARVVLSEGIIIPTRAVLIDTRNATAYVAEIVWLKAPEFGLKFSPRIRSRGRSRRSCST